MDYLPVFEGKLLWSGQRITDFTLRELCNMAYYHHVSQFQPSSGDREISVEEQIESFDSAIGQRVSSEAKAMQQFREMMIAMGKDPDAKPELSPELQAKMERDAMMSDTDIFFSDTNREFRGRQLKGKDYEFDE